ncbi:hypothetical protein BJ972_002720 [Agromyces atrinae]|uniref:Uncharacterized protein n=1 Tax=Agromyces atrinae TaxID=592376 RepID=A0A852SJI3_9MICO|nr:hypothetical protein [Agromyces atrinae]
MTRRETDAPARRIPHPTLRIATNAPCASAGTGHSWQLAGQSGTETGRVASFGPCGAPTTGRKWQYGGLERGGGRADGGTVGMLPTVVSAQGPAPTTSGNTRAGRDPTASAATAPTDDASARHPPPTPANCHESTVREHHDGAFVATRRAVGHGDGSCCQFRPVRGARDGPKVATHEPDGTRPRVRRRRRRMTRARVIRHPPLRIATKAPCASAGTGHSWQLAGRPGAYVAHGGGCAGLSTHHEWQHNGRGRGTGRGGGGRHAPPRRRP